MRRFDKNEHADPNVRRRQGSWLWEVPDLRDIDGKQREFMVLRLLNGWTQDSCIKLFMKEKFPLAYLHWKYLNTWQHDKLAKSPITVRDPNNVVDFLTLNVVL